MSLPFTCALVTGGGGGIGKALASYLTSKGVKVLLAGRTESKLKTALQETGAADYYVFDTGDVATIPAFIARVTAEHPDLDCLINNAGVQRPLNIMHMPPAEFLQKADQEININIRGPMHLALGLLDHLRARPRATIMNVSSALAFLPTSIINPVYNGTKAWLHFWSMNLRTQIAWAGLGEKIKVVEIAPPSVETDLHREREDPDDNKKRNDPNVLSLEEFMQEVSAKLERGEEMIGAGVSTELIDKWYATYGQMYTDAVTR
ncbi:putative short-chain dehydrogenases/reductase [Aspergillus sclerotiicarbonarius CBS 121057]|uniref:Putative short-chain dehydrogenases/reductase n=1 Tax=Aspergillus sclerotiicarbonarius (strain CBS 121057 / IBT 28362) TaxID=1448318 RepID=A0A319DZ81_ASPSB|nr:putative short-chain dehydrogenases/reductase [Aspergillus sclerotiicarbonarius CBS 121057]